MADIRTQAAPRNGAQALVAGIIAAGVEVCFLNPGRSGMHLVHALGAAPTMRSVLALHESVVTGAADGYGRVARRPAAVLLHQGAGLANGLANLHNARRAKTPLVCLVIGHATGHVRYDAPLQTDIAALARTESGWVHTSSTGRDTAADALRVVSAAAAGGGTIAVLILPADVLWEPTAQPVASRRSSPQAAVGADVIDELCGAFGDGETTLLLGGAALSERGLRAASRIARATGAHLFAEAFPARMEAGAGVPAVPRLEYEPVLAIEQLSGTRTLILCGARAPVASFADPRLPGELVPDGCRIVELIDPGQDAESILDGLADRLAAAVDLPALDASASGTPPAAARPFELSGPLTPESLAATLAATLPTGAIVVDEAHSSGAFLPRKLADAARHTLLTVTGGAIGQGLPLATGAALAEPDRPVLAIEADGGALYTIQALWTQARERLNVTTVLINNSSYANLRRELDRTGMGEVGEPAARMLDLSDPPIGFTGLSAALGVPSCRVTEAPELAAALARAYAEPGPHLVEAVVPPPLDGESSQTRVPRRDCVPSPENIENA
jgi:acetolactate synthase I/II/III large subunit